MRIKTLADRFALLDAVTLEGLEQLALGQLNTGDQRLDGGVVLALALGLRHSVERAAEIIGGADDIGREFGDRIGALVLQFALGAAAQVFHFRERAQEAVLEIGVLALERLDAREILGGAARHFLSGGAFSLRAGRIFLLVIGTHRNPLSKRCLPAS